MNFEDNNRAALKQRERFRKALANGSASRAEFQTLKHKFPFIGFVECRAEGIPFVLFSCNDDVVAWEYFWLGDDAYEPPIVKQWIAWAKDAKSILDVGAYTGLMSVLAGLVNPECKIHVIEPIERTIERAKINIVANGVNERVTLHPRAAGANFGVEMINFYRPRDFLGTGNSIDDKKKKIFDRQMIQVVKLDQYLGSLHKFDLIKVDVEGFESQALAGLRQIMRRDRPRLILEVWKKNEVDVFKQLDRLNYRYESVEKGPAEVRNFICEPR